MRANSLQRQLCVLICGHSVNSADVMQPVFHINHSVQLCVFPVPAGSWRLHVHVASHCPPMWSGAPGSCSLPTAQGQMLRTLASHGSTFKMPRRTWQRSSSQVTRPSLQRTYRGRSHGHSEDSCCRKQPVSPVSISFAHQGGIARLGALDIACFSQCRILPLSAAHARCSCQLHILCGITNWAVQGLP